MSPIAHFCFVVLVLCAFIAGSALFAEVYLWAVGP